jgi:predicted TIM-barrel fold metal-dependent hydrolase
MRQRLGIHGHGEQQDNEVEAKLVATIAGAKPLDAAVVLAFDAVYTDDGQRDEARTHLYVSNDYVIDLARRHSQVLFACSVHPYRKDAVAEIERCVAAGAVQMKWLPIVQGFNPADPRCMPVYECLAHHGLPLLSHTGGEHTLPRVDDAMADPMLLLPAIKAGVTVIAAHCGTKSFPGERSYLPEWSRLAKEHERFYGDTSALDLPMRSYAYDTVLNDPVLRSKLLHGSDWPVIPVPPVRLLGLWAEPNWMARDIQIKRRLGLTEDEYWHRASKVLRMPAAGDGSGMGGAGK